MAVVGWSGRMRAMSGSVSVEEGGDSVGEGWSEVGKALSRDSYDGPAAVDRAVVLDHADYESCRAEHQRPP